MLIKADDKLVPEFLQALSETNQKHVADILVGKSLNTFVVLCSSTGLHVSLCRLFSPKFQSLRWLRDTLSKVYQKFVFYPDISPALSLKFMGLKNCETWSNFGLWDTIV